MIYEILVGFGLFFVACVVLVVVVQPRRIAMNKKRKDVNSSESND